MFEVGEFSSLAAGPTGKGGRKCPADGLRGLLLSVVKKRFGDDSESDVPAEERASR